MVDVASVALARRFRPEGVVLMVHAEGERGMQQWVGE